MEISGFKVDQVFVVHWLKRHFIKDPTVDTAVLDFINNQADYLKEKAIQQYKLSQKPIEKLEYNLNKLIGPSKIKDRVQFCLDQQQPTTEALSHVLEKDIFDSPIIDDVCLFPKSMTKIARMSELTSSYNSAAKPKAEISKSQSTSVIS